MLLRSVDRVLLQYKKAPTKVSPAATEKWKSRRRLGKHVNISGNAHKTENEIVNLYIHGVKGLCEMEAEWLISWFADWTSLLQNKCYGVVIWGMQRQKAKRKTKKNPPCLLSQLKLVTCNGIFSENIVSRGGKSVYFYITASSIPDDILDWPLSKQEY